MRSRRSKWRKARLAQAAKIREMERILAPQYQTFVVQMHPSQAEAIREELLKWSKELGKFIFNRRKKP